MMRAWVACLILTAGCSGSPTSPTPVPSATPAPSPSPSPQPAPRPTVAGTITDTVSGARVGSFSQEVDRLPVLLPVSAGGFVTRQAWITSAAPTVDLIPEAGFDLAFYRQFVRGGLTQTPLEPLRRLTQSPRFYVRTVDQAGGRIDSTVVNYVSSLIVTSRIVEAYTGGRFTAAAVESGPDTREGVAGWITIRWNAHDPAGIGCGRSQIAGVWVDLTYHTRCSCPGASTHTFPLLVKHEIGHALGFWHTDGRQDLMYSGTQASDCDNNPSPRERSHAAIAYARPVGSRDVDQDPTGSPSLLPRVVIN